MKCLYYDARSKTRQNFRAGLHLNIDFSPRVVMVVYDFFKFVFSGEEVAGVVEDCVLQG